MWVIIGKSTTNPTAFHEYWISGVFREQIDAQQYLDSIPKNLNTKKFGEAIQELREFPAHDYPVVFLDDFNQTSSIWSWSSTDFKFVTPEELAKYLFDLKKIEDDHLYLNYYIFHKDYRAHKPGEDSLGSTDHHHCDNDEIKSLLHIGLDVRSLGHLEGTFVCKYWQCDKKATGILTSKGFGPPSGWKILPWAGSKNWKVPSYQRKNDDETVPETHEATYLIVCSDDCFRNYLAEYNHD
jgi:hypothetical protein